MYKLIAPTYIVKHTGGTPKIMEFDKCSEIKWMNFEEIDYDTLSTASQSNFNAYKKKINSEKQS